MLSFIAQRANEEADALVRPDGLRLTYGALGMATAAVQQVIDARAGDVRGLVVGIAVADAAGFVASLLAVLEAGGVALPLRYVGSGSSEAELMAAEAEAQAARAVAVVVGDASEDRLDVVAVDASRRTLPAEAALLLPGAAGRRAVIAAAALGATVDAVVAAELRTPATRTPIVAPFAAPGTLIDILATLRAGGTLVDARTPAQPGALRGLDAAECLRVGHAGVDRIVHALPAGALAVVDGAELEARGPGLMMGYLDDEAGSHAAWSTRNGERWLRLGRLVEGAAGGAAEVALIAVAAGGDGVRLHGFCDDERVTFPAAVKRVLLDSLPHGADGAIDRRALLRMASAD